MLQAIEKEARSKGTKKVSMYHVCVASFYSLASDTSASVH